MQSMDCTVRKAWIDIIHVQTMDPNGLYLRALHKVWTWTAMHAQRWIHALYLAAGNA